jgi:hypothetical protein
VYLVLLENNCWVRFNEIYFIIFVLKVWKILNFEWILSFCKFKQITTNWVEKGKWIECVHAWGQQHMLPYLCMREGSLFCFFIMIYPKPWCLRLCYGTYHATTWFRMFGVTMWTLLIIKPFFHWIFWKTKIENCIGIWGVLGIVRKPSPSLI